MSNTAEYLQPQQIRFETVSINPAANEQEGHSHNSLFDGTHLLLGMNQDQDDHNLVLRTQELIGKPETNLSGIMINTFDRNNSYGNSDNIVAEYTDFILKQIEGNPQTKHLHILEQLQGKIRRLNQEQGENSLDIAISLISNDGTMFSLNAGRQVITVLHTDGTKEVVKLLFTGEDSIIQYTKLSTGDRVISSSQEVASRVDHEQHQSVQGTLDMIHDDYPVIIGEYSRENESKTDDTQDDSVTSNQSLEDVLIKLENAQINPVSTLEQLANSNEKEYQNLESITGINIEELEAVVKSEYVRKLVSEEEYKPSQLIELLCNDDRLKQLFDSTAQVYEGYSIRQHTEMAGNQYEKYFSYSRNVKPTLDGKVLDEGFMRAFLIIHDLGKAISIEKTGSKQQQHTYAETIVPQLMEWMGYSNKEIMVAQTLAGQDWLGRFIIGGTGTSEERALTISAEIQQKASEIGIPTYELYNLARTYYLVDAGSYTADAGGIPSLDHLFYFSHGEADFEYRTRTRVGILDDKISEIEDQEFAERRKVTSKDVDVDLMETEMGTRITKVINQPAFVEYIRTFLPDRKYHNASDVRGYVITRTIEYLTLDTEGKFLKEFLAEMKDPSDDKEIANLYIRNAAALIESLDIKDIHDYIEQHLNSGGYYFHGFNGVYEDQIKKDGLSPSKRVWDDNEIQEIYQFAGRIFGWYNINSKGNLFFAGTPRDTYRYAVASPEWFAQFTSEDYHIKNNRLRKTAYYRRDYKTARQNIVDFCASRMSAKPEEVSAGKRYRNFTQEEVGKIMHLFEKYWSIFAGEKASPKVALIKKSAIVDYMELPSPKIIDSERTQRRVERWISGTVDGSTQQTIPPEDLVIIDLPDYNKVHGYK